MSALRPSIFQSSDLVPPDAIFDTTKRYVADQDPGKINLGQGVYRDGNGDPWVLPSVQAAKNGLGDFNHEYLPIGGYKPFVDAATGLVFKDTSALKEERIASCQALSGTGALLIIGLTLQKINQAIDTIYITDPSWPIHATQFRHIGFNVETIPYYKAGAFDFKSFTETLRSAKPNSAVVLHACAHNPTGCDPSMAQWEAIASIIAEKSLFPIFDAAYLGFNSGSFDDDTRVIRYFIEDKGLEAAVSVSMAKNMGLYSERVGLAAFVTSSPEPRAAAQSVLESMQRVTVSNPPAYGARLAAAVIGTPALKEQWMTDMGTMAGRIKVMRKRLYEELGRLGTPGDWAHVVQQSGMFAYLGLSRTQVRYLEERFHVYMAASSRISVAGLNEHNVDRFAQALDETVRKVK